MDMTSGELLWEWLRFGWSYRDIGKLPRETREWYTTRVKREMALILDKGFADYFLLVSDAIRWGKDRGIAFGPGRGSVAASAVAYLLRITEISPHRYPQMMFERFMDETRSDPPDIDIDIEDTRRHEVYEYLQGKYGRECVGHIADFVRYRARNSLADVARVYGIPLAAREEVASLVIERARGDDRADKTLEDTFDIFQQAKDVLGNFPDLAKACRLEGDVRGMSVHAAGLVIANSPLTSMCAVYAKDEESVLSLDKYDAEYIGALKLDFLGLTTMGAIALCLDMAGLTPGDLYAIKDTDQTALSLFRTNDLTGVFQFSGRAARQVCRDVAPENFGHVIDVNALARPGPLSSGQAAEYTEVRHGRKQSTSMHPIVDNITRATYGQIIYQEQILRVLRDVGGLDWPDVHHIRRIISKSAGEAAFQENYATFASGASRLHGLGEEASKSIWDRLVTSGAYAFNIAHAVSYSVLALWCAWLKANFPLEFYASMLIKATGNEQLQFRLMQDALRHSIDIKPPHISHSRATWNPVRDKDGNGNGNPCLVAGWQQVPKIGEKTAQRIEELGRERGGFDDWIELTAVPGIGARTIARLEEWSESKDPFGLYRTGERLAAVRRFLKGKGKGLAPLPTHDGRTLGSLKVPPPGERRRFTQGPPVVYMAMVSRVEYKDVVEDIRARTGKSTEEILATLDSSQLKRAVLHCYDATDEEVYARISQYRFRELENQLALIRTNQDVVVLQGHRAFGFGSPISVKKICIFDPDD